MSCVGRSITPRPTRRPSGGSDPARTSFAMLRFDLVGQITKLSNHIKSEWLAVTEARRESRCNSDQSQCCLGTALTKSYLSPCGCLDPLQGRSGLVTASEHCAPP